MRLYLDILLFPIRALSHLLDHTLSVLVSVLAFAPLLLSVWVLIGYFGLAAGLLDPAICLGLFFVSGTVFSVARALQRRWRLSRLKRGPSRTAQAKSRDAIAKAHSAKTPTVSALLTVRHGRRLSLGGMRRRLPRHLRRMTA